MTTQKPRSCLVHGPAGCGKTTNAQAIARALGLSQILDNWDAGDPVPLLDTLVLTNADNPAWYFKGRVMTFEQAMQFAQQRLAIPTSEAEHHAAAWLGQAGLYRTRFDAVRNCEQSVRPVSADELYDLASKQVLSQLNGGRQRA
ncbi:AAA family ATPase [Pseudomonas asiatica]|uniref:AAA family ATPase n=1 Tax=Pseudomonas asiatica TaxID=2219225 RepID=UPI00244AAE14|nr:AAA family ATPase [Pseudomonas asiatica]MDH0133505.1 AAA family ATPase [Pseudomonas asiatica]